MTKPDSNIGTQVKLPMSVALEVVLQGIRIRLGRSLVTMLGIVLGIAFLMAILTGEVVKRGVSEEQQLRNNVKRMVNFLSAEIGPPRGRRFAILVGGKLTPAEQRLLSSLHREGAEELTYAAAAAGIAPQPDVTSIAVSKSLDSVADQAHALLVVGGVPETVDWNRLMAPARNRVVGFATEESLASVGEGIVPLKLQRKLREEELQKIEAEKRRSKFRRNWIVVISLIASVISISNAMLMSVTERFREIGTMKCLGAMSTFIRKIFLIESSLMGIAGSVVGCVVGFAFALIAYSVTYGVGLVFGSLAIGSVALYVGFCLAIGVVLSIVAAFYPARFASQMVPAHALRTNV